MARLDTDLLGLQIVSKEDASLVGEIDGLILDEQSLTVAGFLVNLGLYEATVLPFERAAAIGPDAVVVERADAVTRITQNQRLEQLARKEITISDATAITVSGKNVGSMGDFFVDTDSGDVVGVEFFPADMSGYAQGTVVIPTSVITRLGRDIVVLSDDYHQHLLRDESSLERLAGRPRGSGGPGGADGVGSASSTGGARGPEAATPGPAAGALSLDEVETEVTEPEPPKAEEAQAAEAESLATEAPEEVEAPAEGEATAEPPTETVSEEPVQEFVEEAPVEVAPEAEEQPAPAEDAQAAAEAPPTEPEAPAPTGADVHEEAPGAREAAVAPEPSTEPAPEPPPAAPAEPAAPRPEDAPAAPPEPQPAEEEEDAFTNGQRHFLIGKRVLRRIETPAGEVLAEEGDIVDHEMIRRAKSSDLLLILSLNVE